MRDVNKIVTKNLNKIQDQKDLGVSMIILKCVLKIGFEKVDWIDISEWRDLIKK